MHVPIYDLGMSSMTGSLSWSGSWHSSWVGCNWVATLVLFDLSYVQQGSIAAENVYCYNTVRVGKISKPKIFPKNPIFANTKSVLQYCQVLLLKTI